LVPPSLKRRLKPAHKDPRIRQENVANDLRYFFLCQDPTMVSVSVRAKMPGDESMIEREKKLSGAGADELLKEAYEDLRHLAEYIFRNEPPGHTIQPTALVHEAWMRLADQKQADWKSRSHFIAVAANIMRRLLVDHARKRNAEKRGGGFERIELEEDLLLTTQKDAHVLAVDDALAKLAELSPDQAKIVEMRFFGGLTSEEIAAVMGVSKRTVDRHWTFAKTWLRKELSVV
jgi:RNA polymerase sigma-70 factor (ECF subfamily)